MDPVTVLIVALVCVAVGYITGIFIGRSGKSQSRPRPDPDVESQPAAPSEAGESAPQQVDLAHFFRTQPGALLSVRMGNQHWENATQVPDTQLTALQGLSGEFQRWLKPLQAPSAADGPAEAAAAQPSAPAQAATSAAAAAAGPVDKPPLIEAKTIVAQIDEVLQEMLVASPLAARKVRLADVPNQGVVVFVDQEQFPGIDAVPDQDVRGLIRQAVAAWETRAS